jgi:putative FmdB family regulatory protein
MPLYEYQCDVCAKRFERIQKFSDPLIETCPSCGGRVQKLLSSPAVHFKGAGWYVTDYAKKSGDTSASKSSSSSSSSSTSSDTSTPSTTTTSDSTTKKD